MRERERRRLLIAALIAVAGCSERNPNVCCTTADECTALGVSEPLSCGDREVCVDNTCVAVQCVDSTECAEPQSVCDPRGHACRGCRADDECASGACELATATCAAEAEIAFVSPGGTTLAPCTRSEPCSLAHAFSQVSTARRYVELTPGTYPEGATLDGAASATLVGNGATVAANDSDGIVGVAGTAALEIRRVAFRAHGEAVSCRDAGRLLVLDATFEGGGISAQCGGVEVGRSSFTDAGIDFGAPGPTDAGLVVDRVIVQRGSVTASGGPVFAKITNSLFVLDDDSQFGVRSAFTSGVTNVATHIENNTVIGGYVVCNQNPDGGLQRYFTSNIFSGQTSALPHANHCHFDYNLASPADPSLNGQDNLGGDPRFVDAAGGDFHLGAGSPAIDRGDPVSTDDHDLDGAHRPGGARVDIGAYEAP